MNTTIIPTGFHTLDALLGGGLRPGTLTVIGSRPGMGRTSFLCNIGDNVQGEYSVFVWDMGEPMDKITKQINRISRHDFNALYVTESNDEKISCRQWRKLLSAGKKRSFAILIAVKLPRSLEEREDKRPILADFGAGLFGRGGAARYADNVIALYRESYYDPLSDWNTPEDVPNAEVIVLKSAGSTGTIPMRFDGKAQKWRETEE